MADIMTDDDIMNMMAEESEKQSRDGPRAPAANGKPAAAAPHAGQHVDVAALLGGRPQPGSPAGGIGSPASLAGSDRTESMRSRFANFFKLEEAPAAAASAAPAPASGGEQTREAWQPSTHCCLAHLLRAPDAWWERCGGGRAAKLPAECQLQLFPT